MFNLSLNTAKTYQLDIKISSRSDIKFYELMNLNNI